METTEVAALLIRLGVGITMVVFGINQIKNPKAWLDYVPGIIRFILPVRTENFMRIHGSGNLGLGAFLLSGLAPMVAIWASLLWWLFILPFAFLKDAMIGMRDFSIIMALISLLLLQNQL